MVVTTTTLPRPSGPSTRTGDRDRHQASQQRGDLARAGHQRPTDELGYHAATLGTPTPAGAAGARHARTAAITRSTDRWSRVRPIGRLTHLVVDRLGQREVARARDRVRDRPAGGAAARVVDHRLHPLRTQRLLERVPSAHAHDVEMPGESAHAATRGSRVRARAPRRTGRRRWHADDPFHASRCGSLAPARRPATRRGGCSRPAPRAGTSRARRSCAASGRDPPGVIGRGHRAAVAERPQILPG
jgi:hypothetical protein